MRASVSLIRLLPIGLAIAAVVALAGCDNASVGRGVNRGHAPAVDLTITVQLSNADPGHSRRLHCNPAFSRDYRDAKAACAALSHAGYQRAFVPTAPMTMCTQIYGGPETARIAGEIGREHIDASFSRVNGCEIARWQRLSALLDWKSAAASGG